MPSVRVNTGNGSSDGNYYVDIFVDHQIETMGIIVGQDARGNDIFDATRIYDDDVPGGPGWSPARIQTAIDMVNAALPDGWIIVRGQEDTGRAHLEFTLMRTV